MRSLLRKAYHKRKAPSHRGAEMGCKETRQASQEPNGDGIDMSRGWIFLKHWD